MELFTLPASTIVNRVVPKNTFEAYATSKQKKLFTELISRITWANKLSTETINLTSKEIKEIQIFKIELKQKESFNPLLELINKAIPYNIIFVLIFEDLYSLSTAIKHTHPQNENNAVIDLSLKTDWFTKEENKYSIQLKGSIDATYHNFCLQLSAKSKKPLKSIDELVEYNKQVNTLEKEILRLEKVIKDSKQFKYKVEYNLDLKQKKHQLKTIKEDTLSSVKDIEAL